MLTYDLTDNSEKNVLFDKVLQNVDAGRERFFFLFPDIRQENLLSGQQMVALYLLLKNYNNCGTRPKRESGVRMVIINYRIRIFTYPIFTTHSLLSSSTYITRN